MKRYCLVLVVFSFCFPGCMTVEEARQQGVPTLDAFLGIKLGAPFAESLNELNVWTKCANGNAIRYEPKVKFSDDYVFYAFILGEKQIVWCVAAVYDLKKHPRPNYAGMLREDAMWAKFGYEQARHKQCWHLKDVLSEKYRKSWHGNKLYFMDKREICIDEFAEVIEAKDVMLQAEFDAAKKKSEFDGL